MAFFFFIFPLFCRFPPKIVMLDFISQIFIVEYCEFYLYWCNFHHPYHVTTSPNTTPWTVFLLSAEYSKTAIFNGLRSGKTTVITWREGQMEFNNLRDVVLKHFFLAAANSACEIFFRIFPSFTQNHVNVSAMRKRGSVSTSLRILRSIRSGEITARMMKRRMMTLKMTTLKMSWRPMMMGGEKIILISNKFFMCILESHWFGMPAWNAA